MSAYTRNGIYTAIVSAIKAYDNDAYCTSTYTQTPPRFPCVFIREIGNFTPTNSVNLAFDENVKNITFEVQIFTNTAGAAQSTAYALLSVIEQRFKELYFIETSAAPIDNADENIYRLVARFSRIIAGGDTMPSDE